MKYCVLLLAISLGFASSCTKEEINDREPIADAMENSIKTELLNKWYPQSIDTVYGGFFIT
jgi:mannobiose 2-epimerase